MCVHLSACVHAYVCSRVCTLLHFQEEREAGDARFTKLKLQAKAKMAALNKQISELKGKEGLNVSQVK